MRAVQAEEFFQSQHRNVQNGMEKTRGHKKQLRILYIFVCPPVARQMTGALLKHPRF